MVDVSTKAVWMPRRPCLCDFCWRPNNRTWEWLWGRGVKEETKAISRNLAWRTE